MSGADNSQSSPPQRRGPGGVPAELSTDGEFAARHLGPDGDEVATMLAALEVDSLDALVGLAVPDSILAKRTLELPSGRSEAHTLDLLAQIAGDNQVMRSLIGLGYHGTVTPGVIKRNVLENPAWYTAYTPYQPEISQGRLEALLNFQTMVSDLTGMEIANASLLDEATAAAEAMTMSHRVTRRDGDVFVVDADCHPQTLAVLRTRAEPLGLQLRTLDRDAATSDGLGDDVFGVLLQYPGSSGEIRDDRDLIAACNEAGILVTVAADLLALVLLTPPGEMGADVVIGSTQRFGVPLGFGGPHAAYLATAERHKRALPGRLVGVSVDTKGRRGLRLALQTREQHIRRERATSNICTSQVLLAVIAGMYGVYHGPDGLTRIARRIHLLTSRLADGLTAAGAEVVTDRFFDTLTVRVPGGAAALHTAARHAGFNLREVDDDTLGISLDETVTAAEIAAILAIFDADAGEGAAAEHGTGFGELARTSEFLTHPVFHRHRSETDMLRYLRRLADLDVALDRSMIPLGSCTMKLNATTEMESITWPGFADIHPFAPADQTAGYRRLIGELENMLAEVTGYHAVSLQPNAGSQGEFAGLLAIRGYHLSRGDEQRTVCLIPESAHGTNAASAVMAGMRVVVVDCDDNGNVDVDDLRAKAEEHEHTLAALMVTYPSTHGVYEERITEICDIVHANGGQVYLDGANLNALVGIAEPGRFGSDVSHLNLHKTFCIPHGGGGPGVGPIGVREHLAPFLPGHPLAPGLVPAAGEAGEHATGPVSAAPWGSAGILPISWAYVTLMGGDGLPEATRYAILNANYLAARLAEHYPVLYTGDNGLVAHECIVDVRGIQAASGVSNEDVAKRLIDYGFHAPTMSFPVAGTLMIEPTESESLRELDRFVDAMIAIREEIRRVEEGEWPADDNPLVNAPHIAEDLLVAEWAHPYDRELAAYPVASLRIGKYWPPVSRIDQAYGDRNLVCACPPMDDYR